MRRKKPQSAKKKLSTDARIWKIVKSRGPITLKDVAKAVEKDDSTAWRNLVLLEDEELIKETQEGYVPFEWQDLETSVRKALRDFKTEHYVKVSLDDIAKKVRQPPKKIEDYAYRWAPEEGLEIAQESEKFSGMPQIA